MQSISEPIECSGQQGRDNASAYTLWPVLFKTILAITVPLRCALNGRKMSVGPGRWLGLG